LENISDREGRSVLPITSSHVFRSERPNAGSVSSKRAAVARSARTKRHALANAAASRERYGPRAKSASSAAAESVGVFSSSSPAELEPGSSIPRTSPRFEMATPHPAGATAPYASETTSAKTRSSASETLWSSAGSSPRFANRRSRRDAVSLSPAARHPRRNPSFWSRGSVSRDEATSKGSGAGSGRR
jgi:hypothetical protein